jgi:hypothetical protein
VQREPLSQREREGPIAKQWEGEGDIYATRTAPSPFRATRSLPLPLGEGFQATASSTGATSTDTFIFWAPDPSTTPSIGAISP